MKVSIIVPVYNEERDLEGTLEKVLNLKFESPIKSYEVIVVNDASTDGSLKVIENLEVKYPELLRKTHSVNLGKGAALKTGIEISTGDYIAFQDSDAELDPGDLPELVKQMIINKVEFANGSRYLPGLIRQTYAYKRYLLNKLFSNLVSFLLNVRITDLACGHKVLSRNLINQFEITEERFGVEAEVIIKVLKLRKNSIIEVPVHYFPRNYGEGKKFQNIDGLRVLFAIFKYSLFK